MFSYLIKKSIFDSAENLIKIIVFNLMLLSAFGFVLNFIINMNNFYAFPILSFMIFLIIASVSFIVYIKKKGSIKNFLLNAVMLGLLNTVIAISSYNALQYYSKGINILANSLSFFIIWILIFWTIISMIILVVISNNNIKFGEILKKSIFISFENIKSIILIFIFFVVLFLLTPLTVVGAGSALILLDNLYELIEIKNNYQKENPGEEMNWDIVLKEKRMVLDKKKLMNHIFTWERKKNTKLYKIF